MGQFANLDTGFSIEIQDHNTEIQCSIVPDKLLEKKEPRTQHIDRFEVQYTLPGGEKRIDVIKIKTENSSRRLRNIDAQIVIQVDPRWRQEDLQVIGQIDPERIFIAFKNALYNSNNPIAKTANALLDRMQVGNFHRWKVLAARSNFSPDIPPGDIIFALIYEATLRIYRTVEISTKHKFVRVFRDQTYGVEKHEVHSIPVTEKDFNTLWPVFLQLIPSSLDQRHILKRYVRQRSWTLDHCVPYLHFPDKFLKNLFKLLQLFN